MLIEVLAALKKKINTVNYRKIGEHLKGEALKLARSERDEKIKKTIAEAKRMIKEYDEKTEIFER